MSKFKVVKKENNTLTFELALMKPDKVSKTNVLSLMIKSLNNLCFPDQDTYHPSNTKLSDNEKNLLKENNPYKQMIIDNGHEFNYLDLDTFSASIYQLHDIVENIVSNVEKLEELPVTKDEELSEDIHYKASYKATFTDSGFIAFLPENFELDVDYMAYHDPGEPDPYENIDMLLNEGFTNESDIEENPSDDAQSKLDTLLKKFGF